MFEKWGPASECVRPCPGETPMSLKEQLLGTGRLFLMKPCVRMATNFRRMVPIRKALLFLVIKAAGLFRPGHNRCRQAGSDAYGLLPRGVFISVEQRTPGQPGGD